MGAAGVLWDVVEEHLDEAGFQWERWERALGSPILGARQVADGVEARLAAHLEGLALAAPIAAERLLGPALREGEAAEAAAAATAMLELPGGIPRVAAALAEADPERREAVSRAVALSRSPAERDLFALLASDHPAHAAAGLEALDLRGVDPGPGLLRFLGSEEAVVAIPALGAARRSTQPSSALVERSMQARDARVRDAALQAGACLGLRSAWTACQRLVDSGDPGSGLALDLLAMSGEPRDGRRLEEATAVQPLRVRALAALGHAGWTSGIEPLLSAMQEGGRIARVAGEAFSAITGIAIEGDLAGEEPDESEDVTFEEDDLDADLVPGAEAELPLPDAPAVAARWGSACASFDPDVRYLHGEPLTADGLVRRFAAAPMRRRRVLAVELAVRSRGAYLVETRDWVVEQLGVARRQRHALGRETELPFSRLLRG